MLYLFYCILIIPIQNDSLATLQEVVYGQLYPDGYPLIPTLTANTSSVITSQSDSTAWQAFDGNDDTYANKMASGVYLGYDFGEQTQINKIKMRVSSWSGSNMAMGFILQTSDDNTIWNDVYTYSDSITVKNIEITDLNLSCRYLRVYSTFSGNSAYGTAIYSWQCYKALK